MLKITNSNRQEEFAAVFGPEIANELADLSEQFIFFQDKLRQKDAGGRFLDLHEEISKITTALMRLVVAFVE